MTLGGSGLTVGPLLSDDLPSFAAYIAAKYPDLPPEATAELVRRFQQLSETHCIAGNPQSASDRGHQR